MKAGIISPALVSIGTEKTDDAPEEGGDIIELHFCDDCDNASNTRADNCWCEEVLVADGHDDDMAAT